MAQPHYLRFAASLAMVCASGCALDHVRAGDGPDAAPPDAGPFECASCECVFGGDRPPPPGSCEAVHHVECCIAVGPLAPPDLRA